MYKLFLLAANSGRLMHNQGDRQMKSMGSETHILVFPFPAQGHINPALQFSKRLASKGLRVTLITTTSVSKSMYIQAGNSVDIESIFDGFNEGELADNIHSNLQLFVSAVSNNLAQLLIETMKHKKKNSSDFPPPKVVLIYDAIMPWCLAIARRLGLRGGAFFSQMGGVCAIYYHQHQGSLKVINSSADQRSSSSANTTFSLPSLPVLEIKDLPSLIPDAALYPSFLSVMVNQFSNFHQADWLLFNTFDKLEEKVLNWMANNQWRIKTVGPTIPSIHLDKRLADDKDYGLNLFNPVSIEACKNWLDKKERNSVVYASLGSLATVGEEQMEELAMGLKNSNHHFLWVVRTSEEGKLPAGGDFSEKGLVVNWCPQLEVLSHGAVGCFVTHCGWNSTLEALSLGVPMVALPVWTDQTTNAKFIVDVWNVGVRVNVNEKGIVTRQELEFSIKQVMEEGERGNQLRKNSVRWRELAKEAVDKGGSSDNNIEALVSEFV